MYGKFRKALELMIPLIENMDEDFRRKLFEKRKERITIGNDYLDNPHGVNAEK